MWQKIWFRIGDMLRPPPASAFTRIWPPPATRSVLFEFCKIVQQHFDFLNTCHIGRHWDVFTSTRLKNPFWNSVKCPWATKNRKNPEIVMKMSRAGAVPSDVCDVIKWWKKEKKVDIYKQVRAELQVRGEALASRAKWFFASGKFILT